MDFDQNSTRGLQDTKEVGSLRGMTPDLQHPLSGVLVPVFSLRSSQDLGVGDVEGVSDMIDWCAKHHFSILQVLPINETGSDNSPYNAISSMALDPTTISITPEILSDLPKGTIERAIPESELKALRQGAVQYRKVKPLKLQLLREAFLQFLKRQDARNTQRADEFRAFLIANGDWIADYALFRTLMHLHDESPAWEQWPHDHRDPARARAWVLAQPVLRRRELEEDTLFFGYVQWIAYEQWTALRRHGERHGVQLMGDIPFGVGRNSADVWANRHLFDLYWSCGAPPESFFKPDLFTERWGQNWGIPLYRWDRMKEDGCAWWRSRIAQAASIFHFFRIDHVLGFYRVYAFPWQPADNDQYTHLSREEARAKSGDLPRFWPRGDDDGHSRWLNQQQGEELLRMVMSAAGHAKVIAEDLGMVPDYVRPSLAALGIPGFKIPIFERHPDGSYRDSTTYPILSVATMATHDHEPIASLWQHWGNSPDGENEKRHLLQWIGWDAAKIPKNFTPELHRALAQKLLECPSWLVVFMITDLFAQTKRFNMPGPMSEGNWAERMDVHVRDFDGTPELAACIRAIEPFLRGKRG